MKPVFSGNPFATPVGQRIDQATDSALTSENWAWNMEICDMINASEDGAKDAVRAIRKKLLNNIGKNYLVVQLTLTVLETCVKNCGRRFHQQIATKEFLLDLIKILTPKYDAPTVVQDKVLSLIQSWAAAFQTAPDLKEVGKMYADLKAKGIEFPVSDLDSSVPIYTPGKSVSHAPAAAQQQRATDQPATRPPAPAATAAASVDARAPSARGGPGVAAPVSVAAPASAQQPQQPTARGISAVQLEKLRSDLDVVQGNCRVFNDMLTELTLGPSGAAVMSDDDLELLHQLESTCRQMQRRVVELLEQVSDERVTERLLLINDELNNVFVRHERFERNRSSSSSQTAAAAGAQRTAAAPAVATVASRAAGSTPPAAAAPPPSAAQTTAPSHASREFAENLIDFDIAPPVATAATAAHPAQTRASGERSALDRSGPAAPTSTVIDDEFDLLALSRQPPPAPLQSQPTAQIPDWKEAEELESWLSQSGAPERSGTPHHDESRDVAATSSEFDEFLRGRASVGQSLPAYDATSSHRTDALPAVAIVASSSAQPRSRQMQKDAEADKTLFAL